MTQIQFENLNRPFKAFTFSVIFLMLGGLGHSQSSDHTMVLNTLPLDICALYKEAERFVEHKFFDPRISFDEEIGTRHLQQMSVWLFDEHDGSGISEVQFQSMVSVAIFVADFNDARIWGYGNFYRSLPQAVKLRLIEMVANEFDRELAIEKYQCLNILPKPENAQDDQDICFGEPLHNAIWLGELPPKLRVSNCT